MQVRSPRSQKATRYTDKAKVKDARLKKQAAATTAKSKNANQRAGETPGLPKPEPTTITARFDEPESAATKAKTKEPARRRRYEIQITGTGKTSTRRRRSTTSARRSSWRNMPRQCGTSAGA